MFDRADRGRTHRQISQSNGRQTNSLNWAARILATKRYGGVCRFAPFDNIFQERQEADV